MSAVQFQALRPEPAQFNQQALDKLLLWAVDNEVSDILLRSDRPVYVSLHGRYLPVLQRRIGQHELAALLDEIYMRSASSRLKGGKDVDFAYEIKRDRTTRLRFRVNGVAVAPVEGAGHGIAVTFRTILSIPPHPSALNIEAEILSATLDNSDGLILIAGPTGSGKTTLMAACIGHALQTPPGKYIVTYEAPIEFNLSLVPDSVGVVAQSEIPKHLPSFYDGIRNGLRRAPNIILVGEARDTETIAETVRAAQTGHLVYSTVHTSGVASVIPRMVSEFEPKDRHAITINLIDIMRLIVFQRLAPSTDGRRVALREYLVFTPDIRKSLIEDVGNGAELQAALREALQTRGRPIYADARTKLENDQIDAHQFDLIRREYDHVQ